MKNNKKEFCLGFGTILTVLVFNNGAVFSTEGVMKPCKATSNSSCVVLCYDWDFGSQNGVKGLKDILRQEGKQHKTCTLIIDHCTLTNSTINPWEGLNPNNKPIINNLNIINSSIDINKFNLKIFQNIHQLTMINTTTATLRQDAFSQLPNLRQLHLKDNKLLKRIQNGFLQNLTLEYLQIQNVDLNRTDIVKFFLNLTSEREIPSVRVLDWSFNNFGIFSRNLLKFFTNLEVLILKNCSIFSFEDGVFTTGSIVRVSVDDNNFELSEGVFKPLIKSGAWVSLKGNQSRDCEVEWVRNWMKDNKVQIDCVVPDEGEICAGNLKNLKFLNESSKKFTITNNNPEYLEIIIQQTTDIENAILLYANYQNTTAPVVNCLKIQHRKFHLPVHPNTNYIICLISQNLQIEWSDCLPLKTTPQYEDQLWLTKKSIPLSIIFIFVVFLFALATGALILYLSVRKNPSLIRGSKRVIEVKRHNKAQILIMPRGYERVNQVEGPPIALPAPRSPLVPSRSCDTISTVSYVSANQPTQLEILTYRFNRLRELFQRNSSFFLPGRMITPISQRLPPNVDLLLEYEWYTITTTTTTQM